MIIGVGFDIVKTNRIARLLKEFGSKFENKIFTKNEVGIASSKTNADFKTQFYAKRFAAKEAFSKATGLGIGRGVNFVDIEVMNDQNGKPKIRLNSKAKDFLQKNFNHNSFKIDLSLTDEEGLAGAFVILSK
jgi:holo-[acyl-carrier protein] synthase